MSTDLFAGEPNLAALQTAYAKIGTNPSAALSEMTALADQGSIASMMYIASMYRNGRHLPVDMAQCESWLQRAHAEGSAFASYSLGLLYLRNHNYTKAREYLADSAAGDFTPALARLGFLYGKGRGVPFDKMKARELLELAYSRGHIIAAKNLAVLLTRNDFGMLQKVRGVGLYAKSLAMVFRKAWQMRKSVDEHALRYLDEQVY